MTTRLASQWVAMVGWAFCIVTANVAFGAAPVKTPVKPQKVEITDDTRQAAEASNGFAFDLYAQLREQEGNLFYSPASISTALAMAYAGAARETERQMATVLHVDKVDVPAGFGSLGKLLNAGGKTYRLQMANRLWAQKTYPFLPPFLTATRDHFGAELAQLNFAQTEPSRQTINRWIEQQTNGKIQNLIPPGAIDASTRLVLTNAIYFKGAWQDEFWKGSTQPAAFHQSKDKQVKSPLMFQLGHFAYAENDLLQLLSLPYFGGELSMVVLLPKQVDGLGDLEQQLSTANLTKWAESGGHRLVEVHLPKFKLTSQFLLGDTLKSMGMDLAFSEQADFSRMSSAEELMLSEVIHKAFVDVSEEGTEAAAATAVPVAPAAAPVEEKPEKPVVFRADHPFVFLIRDNRTGSVLFIGRLVNPLT